MAAEMKCHQCSNVRRCKMVQDTSITPPILVYLCPACCRELGYTTKSAAPTGRQED